MPYLVTLRDQQYATTFRGPQRFDTDQVWRVGVGGGQQEVGGQRVAAGGTASSAHDTHPAPGEALLPQVPVPWWLPAIDKHHHVLVQAQAQVRVHLDHDKGLSVRCFILQKVAEDATCGTVIASSRLIGSLTSSRLSWRLQKKILLCAKDAKPSVFWLQEESVPALHLARQVTQ